MSKPEVESLLNDRRRFLEFVKAAYRSFGGQEGGYIVYEDVRRVLGRTAQNLESPMPGEEEMQETYDRLREGEEGITLEKFTVFISSIFKRLIREP